MSCDGRERLHLDRACDRVAAVVVAGGAEELDYARADFGGVDVDDTADEAEVRVKVVSTRHALILGEGESSLRVEKVQAGQAVAPD